MGTHSDLGVRYSDLQSESDISLNDRVEVSSSLSLLVVSFYLCVFKICSIWWLFNVNIFVVVVNPVGNLNNFNFYSYSHVSRDCMESEFCRCCISSVRALSDS